jgi:hypothetical protein
MYLHKGLENAGPLLKRHIAVLLLLISHVAVLFLLEDRARDPRPLDPK